MNEKINTGLLSQCYMKGVICVSKSKVKVTKGEFKGQAVYICNEGYSSEEKDCPLDK